MSIYSLYVLFKYGMNPQTHTRTNTKFSMVPLAIRLHKTFHPAFDQTIVAEIRRAVIQQK